MAFLQIHHQAIKRGKLSQISLISDISNKLYNLEKVGKIEEEKKWHFPLGVTPLPLLMELVYHFPFQKYTKKA